ncbi:MAG: nucleotidyl transferase AbiEii/AbiGii toxin family protein [Candidatus Acidiferrales bacterium]
MKLFEHEDFEQAIIRAAEHFRDRGLKVAVIEKDYYVTEALRIIAATAPDKIIFKGGTSLAKGWNLIQRFSEDIDIFLDPRAFGPVLGKNAIDRELRKLRDAVGTHPALTFIADESRTIGGFALAKDWIQSLVSKLSDIRSKRSSDMDALADILGGDPVELARNYVPPHCQRFNPADSPFESDDAVVRQSEQEHRVEHSARSSVKRPLLTTTQNDCRLSSEKTDLFATHRPKPV